MPLQKSTDRKIQNWNDLKVFLAVARAGSLAGAARVLALNHSTVYRRIVALEETTGARLFERLPRGYELTEVGEGILALVQRIEDDVHSIGRQVLGADATMRGRVRLTTVDELGMVIAPALRAFHQEYPQVQLEMSAEQRIVSLSRREADVALRPGPKPTEPDVVGRRLCGIATAGYASKAYIEQHGRPDAKSSLANHTCVLLDERMEHIVAQSWFRTLATDSRVAMRANNMMGVLTACKAGFGVASLPCFMADSEPNLVRVLDTHEFRSYGLWLLIHADLRQTARVRCFVDFLSSAIAKMTPLFEGTGTPLAS